MAARNSAPNLDVTVIIPTFNGERYLGRILDALREQDTDAGFEVLVVDSGSTDATLDIVAARVGALGEAQLRLHQIPNSEFGHGRTRNLAAQLARGRPGGARAGAEDVCLTPPKNIGDSATPRSV